jgi:AcrR family transcriptional regulator/acyl-CoA thioesterase FadM
VSKLPTTPRQDTRRAELIEAARRVIQQRGFAKTTVGAITSEAGASLGLLNYHFGSRDDVVAEAFATAAREDLGTIEEAARRYEDPAERLAAFLALSDWADRDAWRMWIDAWGEGVHTEALRATLEDFQRGWRAVLANVLADGDRQGCWRCPDPDDVAGRLVASLDGIGLHTTLHPDDVSLDAAAAWARRLTELELGVELPAAPPPELPRTGRPPYEARIPIRGRDLDATGRVHPAVLLTYLGEAREAWLQERLAGLGEAPRLRVTHVSADFRHALTHSDAEVIVRCALNSLGSTSIRTREWIETLDGAVVTVAAATVAVVAEGGVARPLTAAERQALAA